MPTIRKLSAEEMMARETAKLSPRQQTAREYDALLADFAPGEWAEVQLDDGDNRLTVRNRLQAAAERRGYTLTFQRTSGTVVRFGVDVAPQPAAPAAESLEGVVPAPEPEPEPTATPKKRGRKPAAVSV